MGKLSIDNLLRKDIKITQKRKLFFIIPAALLLVGVLFFGIYWGTTGSPLNLGMDFTGGHTIQINAGTKITEDTFNDYKELMTTFFEDYKYEQSGTEYTLKLNAITRIGSGADTSMRIEFRGGDNLTKANDEIIMPSIIEDLEEKLNKMVGNETPAVTNNGATVTARFGIPVKSYQRSEYFRDALAAAGISTGKVTLGEDNKSISFTVTGELTQNEAAMRAAVTEALTIPDPYSARALSTDMIGGTVSSDLIISAITAVLIALVLMLLYIVIRFEFASGLASVLALIHDVVMMFVLMIVFRIEFNSTFIAAIITILGYSINNSIIIFDRIRENQKTMYAKDKKVTGDAIANRSIVETLGRSINTTLTTLIMIVMVALVCAIGGIFDMVTFSLPIIFGLLAGMFSSVIIAPSLWVMMRKNNVAPRKAFFKDKETKEKQEAVVVQAAPISVGEAD